MAGKPRNNVVNNHPIMNKHTLDRMKGALSCFTSIECLLAEYEVVSRIGDSTEMNRIRQEMIACWRTIRNTAAILEEGGYA